MVYVPDAQGGLPAGPHYCTYWVRVPASAVPYVPRTLAPQVHLAVVLLAASSPGGTEPIAIFADVFDPAQSQLDGMVRLFQVRDFVAEEWPHVLQGVA